MKSPYKGQERPVHHGVNWLTGSPSKRAEIANASAGPCISPGAKGRFGCQLPHPVASMFGCRSRSRDVAKLKSEKIIGNS